MTNKEKIEKTFPDIWNKELSVAEWEEWFKKEYKEPTTKNDLGVREFEEIVVEYPPEDLCTYPEYKGKPYFSIKYKEGNDYIIGYGTYKPEVLSRYLRDYFMSSVTPQEPKSFKWCTDCKEYDQEKHCCHRYSKVIRNTVAEMKQEYIEREVLDKIRAEIINLTDGETPEHIWNVDVLEIIDKYKGESEG